MIIFDVCNDPCGNMATGRSLMVVFNFVKTCVSIHLVIALFQVVVIVASDDGQPLKERWQAGKSLQFVPLLEYS